MASVVTLRPVTQRRSVGLAVGISLLVGLLVAGLAFANSIGASRVSDNALALHWTNATLGTAAATRLALVQATTFVELSADGNASRGDVDFAMAQARNARDELGTLEVGGDAAESLPFLSHYIGAVDRTLVALENGDGNDAHRLVMSDLEKSYMELVDALHEEQAAIEEQIAANTEGAARVNDFLTFFLTFAIPGSAVVIYRAMARRKVRDYQIKAELEIEAERAVGRAKDEFIAGLSHELRTPLTSIYGFAEVLTDGGVEDPGTTQELAQIIANESAEMTRMVDDLLAAARIESTGIEIESAPVRAFDVVESAITPFKRAGLEVAYAGDNAWLHTDSARLRHVLVNLISNAVRHGGPKIGIEVSAADDTVGIEVWDNGPGVPEDKVDRLFDRFVHDGSSPLLTGSLGLGLAVASRLTHLLGGKLTYQRFVQKSYFTVALPEWIEDSEESSAESVAEVIKAMSA